MPNPTQSDPPARVQIHRAVLSESRFHNKASLDAIARYLRGAKAIGKLTVNFSQGGITSVTFEARHLLNGSDHIELKFEGD